MKFFSLTTPTHRVSFAQAIRAGLAPDRGLYFPEHIPALPRDVWLGASSKTAGEIASHLMAPFVGDAIPHIELEELMCDALNFPFEMVHMSDWFPGCSVLELFHGPTAAFKDVGARVMSRLLGRLTDEKLTVLVATSGDTGSAVAQGFLNVPDIDVVILYPSGRISEIQELQLTTVGNNVVALEVEGSFDDCQSMVKSAFLDVQIQTQRPLTSANSINLARWMPQAVYYAMATRLMGQPLNFVVPSGNFGNLAAGILAHRMGMPAGHFVAATNANDVIPAYLNSGEFHPQPSQETLSNAMDVGDPSNRPRMEALLGGVAGMRRALYGCSIEDEQTMETMQKVHQQCGELVCPHTAVGLEAARIWQGQNLHSGYPTVVLGTAHPAKFGGVVQRATGVDPQLPKSLQAAASGQKESTVIDPTIEALKTYLLSGA